MEGGNYFTCFQNKDVNSKRILYILENKDIVKMNRDKKQVAYNYSWELTKKGKELVSKNKSLQLFWKKGKIEEFYNKIISLLGENGNDF